MRLLTVLFPAGLSALSLVLPTYAATVNKVLDDIAKITTDYTTVNAAIVGFPNIGGSLASALAIHVAYTNIIPDVNTATTDMNNILAVSIADGTDILNAMNSLKPLVITSLTNVVAKKAALSVLPVSGLPALIKADLNDLYTAHAALHSALIFKTPISLQYSASSITSAINSAFATAIAAYA